MPIFPIEARKLSTSTHALVLKVVDPLVLNQRAEIMQWVLGHAHLSTTQIYVTPTADEVIESVRAHHARQGQPRPVPAQPAAGYREDSLDILFGR